MSQPTNDIKFNAQNGLAVGASGFPVIDTQGNWVGASGPGQSPYGATGSIGYTGASGATGADGEQGTTGDTGATGIVGATGYTGASGVTGDTGTDGASGAQGSQGSQGLTGQDGAQGYDGATGVQGVTGDQGPTGETGATGGFGSTNMVTNGWTFDTNYVNGVIGLTNYNTSAEDGDVGYEVVLGTKELDYSSGSYYFMFSISVDQVTDNGSFIGIANRNASLEDVLGSADGNSAGFKSDGSYWYSGGAQNTGLPQWEQGDIVDIAVDQDNGWIWIRVNGGNWNNDRTANPSNPTGGLPTIISGPWYPAVSIYGSSGPTTLTIQESASYPVPTGTQNYLFLPAGIPLNTGAQGYTGVTGLTGATGSYGHRYKTSSTTAFTLASTGATGVVVADSRLSYGSGETIILTDGGGRHQHGTVTSYDPATNILAFTQTDHTGTGSHNAWVINLDGAVGQIGATGVTGQDGAQGIDGEQGYQGSSFGTQGATGADGATGTVGLTGATGVPGATGERGFQGATGEAGIDGASGADGIQGSTGLQGATGPDGEQGYQGASGATGYTGATGAQGTDGTDILVYWDTSFGHYGSHQSIDNSVDGILNAGGPAVYGDFTAGQESAITLQTARMGSGGVDKSMFSILQTNDQGGKFGYIGFADEAFYNQSFLGFDDHSVGINVRTGDLWYNNAIVASGLVTSSSGDLIDVAVNFSAGLLWVRKNGGAWNGDPEAGTGGAEFAQPTQGHATPAITTDGQQGFAIQIASLHSVPAGYTFLGGNLATNTGYMGSTGATGATGPDGNQGIDGASGPTGRDGATGYSGATGVTGDQGQTGPQGATGGNGGTYESIDATVTAALDNAWLVYPTLYGSYIRIDGRALSATPAPGMTFVYNSVTYTVYDYVDQGDISFLGLTNTPITVGDVPVNATITITGFTAATNYGYQGATGHQGTDGASGVTGQTGATGATGAAGIDGASGPTGETGTDGATGSYGHRFKATLTSGDSGFQIGLYAGQTGSIDLQIDSQTLDYSYSFSAGQTIIIYKDATNYSTALVNSYDNSTGALNVTIVTDTGSSDLGDTLYVNLDGAVGIEGASGVTGQDGATGIFGSTGATGAFGEQGYTGSTGATGPIGQTGLDGAQGYDGVQGYQGDQGPTGPDGAQGIDGEQGYQGASGSTGYTGLQGYSLNQGSTGLTTTSQATVDMFAANEVGTAKYIVQGVTPANKVQATEVILTQNGSAVWMTEYATLRSDINTKVMDVTATTNGSVISLKVTPTTANTAISWVRESVQGRIGGTTVDDASGMNTFGSFDHNDNGSIPTGKAYLYPDTYWSNLIDFNSLVGTSVTFDAAGVGPQNPAIGDIVSWDGVTLIVTITSGNFQSRTDFDKITYGY